MLHRHQASLAWLDRAVALAATAVLVGLHSIYFFNAGGLWRDETNTVNLANLPLREGWASLQFDAFPVVWLALLRAWTACGLGGSDLGLRLLGLLVGLMILAVLWRNASAFGSGAPVVSLGLLGFNAAVIVYGDSLRAYGIGILLGLLSFGLLWDFVMRPTARTFLVALAASLVSVHCTFYNALLLAASCAAGCAVALRRAELRLVGWLIGLGALCALSLSLYLPMMASQKAWNAIIRHPVDLGVIWAGFCAATESTMRFAPWLWIGGALLGAVTVLRLARKADVENRRLDLLVYCGAALAVIVPGYVLFLLRLGYLVQPWYFLALLSLVAACLDGLLALPVGSARLRLVRAVAVVVIMALATGGIWRAVHERRTNLDLVAAKLGTLVGAGDLVVVNPWYLGISFDRYYRGPAEWATVPPLASHTLHRFDLLKRAMMSPHENQELLDMIRATLLSGSSVYLVGDLATASGGSPPPVLPRAPDAVWGWSEEPYYRGWQLQVAHAFWEHGDSARRIPVPAERQVSIYEDAPLTVVSRRSQHLEGD